MQGTGRVGTRWLCTTLRISSGFTNISEAAGRRGAPNNSYETRCSIAKPASESFPNTLRQARRNERVRKSSIRGAEIHQPRNLPKERNRGRNTGLVCRRARRVLRLLACKRGKDQTDPQQFSGPGDGERHSRQSERRMGGGARTNFGG